MKRRDFVSMLLGSTAAIVIPQRVISLPPWCRYAYPHPSEVNFTTLPYVVTAEEIETNLYLTSKDAWFIKTEHLDGIRELNEAALEKLVQDIRVMTVDRRQALSIHPTRFVRTSFVRLRA